MQRKIDREEYEYIAKNDTDDFMKYSSKRFLEESIASTDVSEQLIYLNRETIKENKKVVSFIEELKNWQFTKIEAGYMKIKITDYEKLKDRIDELENELLLKQKQIPQNNENSFELQELQDELTYKNDLLGNRDKEIQDLKNQLQKTRFENSTYEKTSNVETIKERLGEYRKKFYAEKKKNDELEREKSNLKSQVESMDKEIKSKVQEITQKGDEEDDNYAYYLKQELMYDYDLLVHMKGEMDEMVQIMETNSLLQQEEFEEEHEEEQVIDNRYFNKEVIQFGI